MAIKGIFTSDSGALSERDTSFSTAILKEERGCETPLYVLSSGMKTEPLTDIAMTWYEEGIQLTRVKITSISEATSCQFQVEDASWINENMVFLVENTGEYMFVKAVMGNVLTVERGIAGTPVEAIAPSDADYFIQLIGTAFEEASERPVGHASNPWPRTNIVQIFRSSWDISGTAKAVNYKFGDRTARNKQEAAYNHAQSIERSIMWGRRHAGVVNGNPLRMMDGVISQIRTNRFVSPAGGLTRRALTDYIERIFSKNIKGYSNERISFCGNTTLRALEEIVYRYGTYNISEATTSFGFVCRKFVTNFGSITLIPHPLMNDSPVWSGEMYTLHPAAMTVGYLRDTFVETEGQGSASNLRDADAGVFTTEMSCKYGLEQTGGVLAGIDVDHYAA